MAVLKSSLILSLVDQVSGRARRINGAIDGITRQSSSLAGMTSRLVAFGGAYLGMSQGWSRTYTAAADAQAALSEIGIKADLSSAQLAGLQQRLTKLSPTVNQSTTDLLAGVDAMTTLGLSAGDAESALPAIAKAATATGSSLSDLSAASVAAMQNMGVSSGEIGKMLEGMASAGNAGAFETRDMAQHFAQLTASAKSLGIEGVGGVTDMAAALQIARRGAGDASTAANNMSNFLGKIMSPEVMKRFKTFGVDVTKELKKAHKQGISPIEHFIRLVDEKTKGGQADLLGQLFGDKQVLDFVRPMISDFKDYIRIRGDAENASGVIADAYAKRMADAHQKTKAFWISIENLGTSIGANLLGPVGEMAEKFAKSLNNLDSHFTVFDSISSRMRGFLSGLGVDTGKGAIQGIHDLIMGSENASAAADRYGKLFGEFQEYGRSIRKFGEDVAKNPIVQFFKDLSPYYLSVLKWSVGFVLVAGAIRKLAGAMMLLSGASTILSAVRGIGGVAAALGLGGGSAAVAGSRGAGVSAAGAAAKNGGQWLARWLGGQGVGDWISAGRKSNGLSMFEKIGSKLGWLGRGAGRLLGMPSMVAEVAARALMDVPTGAIASASKDNPDLTSTLMAGRNRWQGVAFEGGMHRAGLGAGPQPVTIDASSIAAMTQPNGVQQVQVTNPQPIEIKVHAPVTISNISSPEGAVEAAASQLGQRAKAAVESSFSGGGGF